MPLDEGANRMKVLGRPAPSRPAHQSGKTQIRGPVALPVSELKNDVRPEVLHAANNLVLLFLPLDFGFGLFFMFNLGVVFAFPPYLPWWLAGMLLGAGFAATGVGTFRGILPLGARPYSPAVLIISEEGMECDLPPVPYRGKNEPTRHVTIPWSGVQKVTPPGFVRYGSLTYESPTPIRTRSGQLLRFTYLALTSDNYRIVQESWSKWKHRQAQK